MKNLHKIWITICLAAMLLPILAFPAAATGTVMEYDGLRVSVVMDKENYAPGEPITATFTVENITSRSITVAGLEQLIPEGYQLVEGSQAAMEKVNLSPGQELSMSVTYVGVQPEGEEAKEDFFDKLIYGKTWGLPNLLLIVVALIAFAVFMFLT